ncbi:MAG: glycosyltransferase family 4 protein [Chloroflexota bacterium]|nr:glycosyltransferase family 4 protein [Chloroflexota bacterium]
MRMLQVCAVDFTAYHLLGPLLRASRRDGWDVEFASADGPFAAILKEEGFRHRPVAMSRAASPTRHLRAIVALAASLRRDPPDLVHTHTPVGGLVGRAASMVAWRGPLVHTFHGLPFQGEPRTPSERAFLIGERIVARRTTRFLSQAAGDVDRAVALRIARRDDTVVIGNGVDVERFAPDRAVRESVRAELGIPSQAIVALTVARLVREKGLLELAAAASQIEPDPLLYFLIVGAALTSERTSVEGELDVHPVVARLGEHWRRLGHRDDVDRLLQAADLFVLPTYREGLPRSIIEAMAVGLPVVASDIPACRELVGPGTTGLLVPPRDVPALTEALRRLASAPEVRAEYGANARARALAHHDERQVLGLQLRIFRQLVR